MARNKFNLSNTKLLTCNVGELVPIGLTELYPGDSIRHNTSIFLRVSPLLTPVMHPVHVRVHHWFVPTRITWDEGTTNFENFITGGEDGASTAVAPTITVNSGSGWAVGSLADYLGIPTGVDDLPVSAIPFRGYALIWNNWYRDEDLQTALTVDKTDGADTTTNTTLQNVCWEKDYLTSARLTAQKGAAVTIPIGTEAVVKTKSTTTFTTGTSGVTFLETDGTLPSGGRNISTSAATGTIGEDGTVSAKAGLDLYPSNLYADLSAVTGISVADLREYLAIQKFRERSMDHGSRYPEYLLSAFHVKSSDARLQRPQYLGGGKAVIQFSEVLQTGVTTSGTPSVGVGSMQGHGIGAMRSNRYQFFAEEHGYVFTLLSVRPKTIYASGLPRHFSRTTKEDYLQPEFEHIGAQEVLNKEAYWAHTTPNGTFGFIPRYDELRRSESSIAGDFRSTLNTWHYARILAADPTLNAAFVSATPTTRVYQSTSADNLYVCAMHNIQVRRQLSKVGSPYIY